MKANYSIPKITKSKYWYIHFRYNGKQFFELNPNSALRFIAKLDYSIKASAHGLFLMKEYICILRSKIGVSARF
jgi:hypothetical protein